MTEANETKKMSWWQIGGRRARLDELETIAHQQAAKIEVLKSQLKDLHQVHQGTQQSLIDANEERIVLERRYNQREQSLKVFKEEQQKWDQEKAQLHHERKQLQKAANEQQEKLTLFAKEQTQGKGQTKTMQAQIDALQQELATSTAQAGTLREECDEVSKQRAALEDILKETSGLLHQKRLENKELKAFRTKAKSNEQGADSIAREARQRHEAELQAHLLHHQIRRQQMFWLWRISVEATSHACGSAAALALEAAWATCLDEWSAAFDGRGDASLTERLTWLTEVLHNAGLCQELTWEQAGDQFTFAFDTSGQPLMPDTLPMALRSPIPTLLTALLQACTDQDVALLTCTSNDDKGYSCVLELRGV